MTNDICARLADPFDPAIVSWRVGPTNREKTKGMALAYIDARDVMRRLDEVCGPEKWQDEYPWSDGKRVVCRIGIKILGSDPDHPDEWIWKTDGAGDTDTEGEKGALSDAFKRAAVKWGIGRYLYDVESPWVAIEEKGRSYVIPDSEFPKLRARLPRPPRPTAPAAARAPDRGASPGHGDDPFRDDDAPPPGARTAVLSQRPAEPASPPQAPTSGHLPPPSPEEPPEAGEARRAARAHFWTRADYSIDPAVIPGGMTRWDAEFLALADAAPSLDALVKLKQDNKEVGHVAAWEDAVQPAVRRHFRERCAAIERRLSAAMEAA